MDDADDATDGPRSGQHGRQKRIAEVIFAALPTGAAELIRAIDVEGASHDGMAYRLDTDLVTVRARHRKARERFRKLAERFYQADLGAGIERWVDLEGEEPPGIRELLDAAVVDVLPLSPEEEKELDARLFKAIARNRRRSEALLPIEALPADIKGELAHLETLGDRALWEVTSERVTNELEDEIDELVAREEAGDATNAERLRLAVLQRSADLVVLRQRHAEALLRARGVYEAGPR